MSGICGTCRYLDILESTQPSERVRAIIADIRVEHECRTDKTEDRAHPDTMIGRRA